MTQTPPPPPGGPFSADPAAWNNVARVQPGNPQLVFVAPPGWAPPKRKSAIRKLLGSMLVGLLLLSIIGNIYMGAAIAAMQESGMDKTVLEKGDENQVVAVYPVTGVIDDTQASNFATFCNELRDTPSVKAVVLRIDSPGGTVGASEQMHHMIQGIQQRNLPVVISMGGTAASGGYYIAAPANAILAEPTTITGSIGVIAQVPNLQGTLDKLGMKMQTYKSSHARIWKDQLSPFKSPPAYEITRMVEILDAMQTNFEKVVRDGRGTKLVTKQESVTIEKQIGDKNVKQTVTETAPLNGKVYLAAEAMEYGLIDAIGYLDDAAARAAKLANLDKPKVVQYSSRRGLLVGILFGKSETPKIQMPDMSMMHTPQILMQWKVE